MKRKYFGIIAAACLLIGLPAAKGSEAVRTADTGTVDFRYAPPWWQASICLPDDPEKALVGKEGQFLFDYGGGGPRNFAFTVQAGAEETPQWRRQEMLSPKVPVVRTTWDAGGVEVVSETFQLVPGGETNSETRPLPRVRLQDGPAPAVQRDWARPKVPCDKGFSNVLVGQGRPIALEIRVPAGQAAAVVFGLCEGWWDKPGQRPLKLSVEGAESRIVDPVAELGKNVPGVYAIAGRDADGNGLIRAAVESAPGAPDRNSILNLLWVFLGDAPPPQSIVRGQSNDKAFAYVAGRPAGGPPRRYLAILTFRNTTPKKQSRRPVVTVEGVVPVRLSDDRSQLSIDDGDTRLLASSPLEDCRQDGRVSTIRLTPIDLPPGELRQVAVTLLRHGAPARGAVLLKEALAERDRACRWWETSGLPWDAIQVPDPAIQGILESCVRNIWQAREIKKGQPAFHVGPTCYRGLWVVDGAFLLESAAIVGRAKEARACIHYILGFQQPDGRIQVMPGGLFHKENGIVLWTCYRHAVLTQDKAWLESVWPKLERIVVAIGRLREQSRRQPPGLQAGLMPTGFVDGGIGGNVAAYSNVYWNLAGLKAAIDGAEWLGKKEQADTWRKEYEDLMAIFRKAAARDLATDKSGNRYLPTIMGEAGKKELPQRGQWAFLHAVYPGQVFTRDDPLVLGNLAMLRATRQQGLVFGTGWDAEGIWTYAASFYAHALLWQGCGEEAAEVLYHYANHAAPLRVWREEQRPVGKGGHEVGDMPHNWASAEFIRLVAHLIAVDRGNNLHLLQGFPRQWTKPGMVTRLKGMATPFGPLHLTVSCDAAGQRATVEFEPLADNCKTVVVHALDGTLRALPAQTRGRTVTPIVERN